MNKLPFALLALLLPSLATAAPSCQDVVVPAPLPASVPAPEMRHAPVSATCVDINAVAYVQRLRQPVPAAPAASSQGYLQKTEFDNTPWRFDMNQNGRRMTAEEFDAWMKAKGIRVATGKPAGNAAPAEAAPAASAATTTCQPSATLTC